MSETALVFNASSEPATRHSGFGIASFVIAILVGVAEFLTIGLAAVAVAYNTGVPQQSSPLMVGIGLAMCGEMAMLPLGMALGFVGLASANTRKPFAVLGVAFNALILLGMVLLMVIGTIAD